jgi:hypothetical protein
MSFLLWLAKLALCFLIDDAKRECRIPNKSNNKHSYHLLTLGCRNIFVKRLGLEENYI